MEGRSATAACKKPIFCEEGSGSPCPFNVIAAMLYPQSTSNSLLLLPSSCDVRPPDPGEVQEASYLAVRQEAAQNMRNKNQMQHSSEQYTPRPAEYLRQSEYTPRQHQNQTQSLYHSQSQPSPRTQTWDAPRANNAVANWDGRAPTRQVCSDFKHAESAFVSRSAHIYGDGTDPDPIHHGHLVCCQVHLLCWSFRVVLGLRHGEPVSRYPLSLFHCYAASTSPDRIMVLAKCFDGTGGALAWLLTTRFEI